MDNLITFIMSKDQVMINNNKINPVSKFLKGRRFSHNLSLAALALVLL